MDAHDLITNAYTAIYRKWMLSKYEKSMIQTIQFFGCGSNCGRLYPYLYLMKGHVWYLDEIGLTGASTVVKRLYKIAKRWDINKLPDLRQQVFEDNQNVYEYEAEGDFYWAYPILRHMINSKQHYTHIKLKDYKVEESVIGEVMQVEEQKWNERLEIIRKKNAKSPNKSSHPTP